MAWDDFNIAWSKLVSVRLKDEDEAEVLRGLPGWLGFRWLFRLLPRPGVVAGVVEPIRLEVGVAVVPQERETSDGVGMYSE